MNVTDTIEPGVVIALTPDEVEMMKDFKQRELDLRAIIAVQARMAADLHTAQWDYIESLYPETKEFHCRLNTEEWLIVVGERVDDPAPSPFKGMMESMMAQMTPTVATSPGGEAHVEVHVGGPVTSEQRAKIEVIAEEMRLRLAELLNGHEPEGEE